MVHPAPPPPRIGPYEVVRELDRGGMATVYEARDPATGRRVAVKWLHRAGVARRFAREYRTLGRLDHPAIVRPFGFGEQDGRPWMAMEFVEGVPIQVHAKAVGRPGDPRRTAEVVRLLIEVAEALQHLHDRGVVHRDLKSANVMVSPAGRVRLLDLGTARLVEPDDEITRVGEFVGTYAYAAPEQIVGGRVTPRADLYSLGVLAYRLLAGRRPFDGDAPRAVARLHLTAPPPALDARVPGLPASLVHLVVSLLAKDPARRPASAAEVAGRLKAILGSPSLLPHLRPSGGEVVGREPELAKLRAMLERAVPGRMAIVVGGEGSGRRRLLGAVVGLAEQLGYRVFRAASPAEGPAGAVGVLLARATGGPGEEASVEARLRTAVAGGPAAEQARDRLLGRLAARLRRSRRRALFVLDRLDLASDAALDLLAGLRRRVRLAESPLLFLASSSPEGDRPAALLRQRFPDAARLELGPLEERDTGRLCQAVLGGHPLSRELVAAVHRATGGWPGLVGETVRALVATGQVVGRDGPSGRVWRRVGSGPLELPDLLDRIVAVRLEGLDSEDLEVLALVALYGGRMPASLAGRVLGPEGLARLERLESARILAFREGAWTLRLGAFREAVLERVGAVRRRELARRLLGVVEETGAGPAWVGLLLEAGERSAAIRAGTRLARRRLAWRQARDLLPLLERLVAAAPRAEGLSRDDLARLYLAWGEALGQVNDRRSADALERAGALARGVEAQAEVDLHVAWVRMTRGDLAGAERRLARVRRALAGRDLPRLRTWMARLIGAQLFYRGALPAAERWYQEALEAARELGEGRPLARALVGRGVLRIGRGALTEAESDLREALARYDEAGDRDGYWHALGNLADLLRQVGAWSEARRLVAAELPAARASATRERLALLLMNLGEVEFELQRLGRARSLLEEVESEFGAEHNLHVAVGVALLRGRMALREGLPELARDVLEPLHARARRAGMGVVTDRLAAWLGAAHVRAGAREAGEALLAQAVEALAGAHNLPALAEACAARAHALPDRDPDEVYAPVLDWMERERVQPLRVGVAVLRARHAQRRGRSERAARWWVEARAELEVLLAGLDPVDRSAMQAHPWTVAVRAGGRG